MKKKLIFFCLLLTIVILGAFCGRKVLAYTYFGSHDGDYMLIRAFVARQMLSEGQIPLRWSGTLQYGCGAPVFTFFYPLFAYLVGGMSLLSGLSVVILMKWLYWSFFMIAGVGFFLWIYSETKSSLASFLGGVLYLLAPYRFVLIFVRGSIEGLGYALLPWVLLSIKLVFEKPKNVWRWLLAITVGSAFFLSHNLVVFFSLPILAAYILFLARRGGKLKWGILLVTFWTGLTLFFWGPALLEQKFTKLPLQKPQVLENLPTIKQLIYSPWGFGPIDFSYSIGLAQWGVLPLAVLVVVILSSRRDRRGIFLLGLMGLSLVVIFLDSNLSGFIWKAFPFLAIIQFPWRLLGFCVFFTAITGAVAVNFIRNTNIQILLIVGISALAFFNVRNYMGANPAYNPQIYSNLDTHSFRHGTATVSDEILPPNQLQACGIGDNWIKGEGVTLIKRQYTETSGFIEFSANDKKLADLTLELSYFPNLYRLSLNSHPVGYSEAQGFVSLKQVEVKAGNNRLEWKIQETPIEAVFTRISLFFVLLTALFISLLLWYSSRKRRYENLRDHSRI